MKARVKFSKQGEMRFVGHLDFMRFFQKVIRRAHIEISYSEGLSPHMIMSFASPLGVGVTSSGDYVDIELAAPLSTEEALRRLNEASADGVCFLDFRQVEEGKAGRAMALVAAADYEVGFRAGLEPAVPGGDWSAGFEAFLAQERIEVVREKKKAVKKAAKGKKKETDEQLAETVDIRPMIYGASVQADSAGLRIIRMRLASGSGANLRPQLVMDAYAAFLGIRPEPFSLRVNRLDLLARGGNGNGFVSLGELGSRI